MNVPSPCMVHTIFALVVIVLSALLACISLIWNDKIYLQTWGIVSLSLYVFLHLFIQCQRCRLEKIDYSASYETDNFVVAPGASEMVGQQL